MKVYHIVYKTTNLLNDKFYIGVHKSTKLQDSYLGSGKWISRSIKKYGRDNFRRENLFIYFSSVEAYSKENELISIHLKDPLCMNLKQGGMDGFDYINENGLCFLKREGEAKRISELGSAKLKYLRNNKEFRDSISLKIKDSILKAIKENRLKIPDWNGKHHSEETKKKMSEKAKINSKGSNNSQFGTCWITKEGINKKIKKEDLQTWLNQGWSKGRTRI